MKRVIGWSLLKASLLSLLIAPAQAQVQVPAAASPQSLGTLIGGTAADVVVTGGTQRGRNLFHAFSRFDLDNNSVTFDGAGTNGVQGIYGRIHQLGASNLNGEIRLRNWGVPSPELLLMNPFGFVVGPNFSSSGLTSLSLLATDALVFQDPADQVFPFDMSVTSAQLGVNDPDWENSAFVGFVSDSAFPDGQGGSPITVNGTIAVEELGLAGSQIDINGNIFSDRIRLFAQSFAGAFYSDPSQGFGQGYQSGSLDVGNLDFIPFTQAAQVGGVADLSGFASTQSELTNPNGFGSCNALACPGMIRFASTSSIQPSLGGSEAFMTVAGRQIVIESNNGSSPLANAFSVQFDSYLDGGIYSHLIRLHDNPAGSASATSVSASESIVPIQSGELTLDDVIKSAQVAPLTAVADLSFSPSAEMAMAPSEPVLLVSSIDGSTAGVAGDSASNVSSVSSGQATTRSTQAQFMTSSEVSSSLQGAEMANAEKVLMALGLQDIADNYEPLSAAEVKISLQKAIADIRAQESPPVAGFDRNNYNPAVLHLRYLSSEEAASTVGDQITLELILITAESESKGLRVVLNKQEFARSLRGLYGALATQQSVHSDDPTSPARWLYQQLFAAIEPTLRDRAVTTLLLSADQGLQAIPYGALHDGNQFLGERFGLALTPSLTLTPLAEPRLAGGAILALGASKFDDLAPLPLVPQELQGVVNGQASELLLNKAFTPDSLLKTAAEERYRRVHVATHAEFLPGGPSESRLHTGTGPLSLQAFRGLRDRRPGSSLDLISLSACRTALGDSSSELGFAGLALQAGARSAIGSLWYVDDVATSAFFVQLYRYLDVGIPKAEALQLTRQAYSQGLIRLDGSVIRGVGDQVLITGLDASQRNLASAGLSHPYFWGGIQLLGSPW